MKLTMNFARGSLYQIGEKKIYIFSSVLVILALLAMLTYSTVQWWGHNRMDVLCLSSGIWPGSKNHLAIEKKALSGDEASQNKLIFDYNASKGGFCMPYDEKNFRDFIVETAEQGWTKSQVLLAHSIGGLLSNNSGRREFLADEPLDVKKAFRLVQDAANNNDRWAQYDMSLAYLVGKWGDVNVHSVGCGKDGKVLNGVTDKRDWWSRCSLSKAYLAGRWGKKSVHIGKDLEKSEEWLRKAVAQGNSSAMYDMARRYRYGDFGTVIDYSQAFEIFMKLSTNYQDAHAMVELAGMYIEGLGVITDYKQAQLWIERAKKFGVSSLYFEAIQSKLQDEVVVETTYLGEKNGG